MKVSGTHAKKSSRVREAICQLDDVKLGQLITALAFNTKLEQSALHYARAEQRRRKHQAKKAAKAAAT